MEFLNDIIKYSLIILILVWAALAANIWGEE